MIRRRIGSAVALLSLIAAAGGCGGDDTADQGSTQGTTSPTVTVALPKADDTGSDTAQALAKSEGKTVYRCASIQPSGDVGHVERGGYHEITARGIDCVEAHKRVLATGKAYNGPAFKTTVDGYACAVIAVDGINATVRCVDAAESAYRFTVHASGKTDSHATPIVACGEFGNFYDISAHNVGCTAVEKLINAVDWRSGTNKAAGYTCTRLYVQGNHPTLRCVDGSKSFRLTIDNQPSPSAPKTLTAPTVVHACGHASDWIAVTAKGIGCDEVKDELVRYQRELLDAGMGGTVDLETQFKCTRLDTSEAESPTVRCVNGDASYRASYVDAALRSEEAADDGQGAMDGATTPATTPTTP